MLFDPDKYELPNGSNDPGGIFPWDALKAEITAMLGQVRLGQPRLPVLAVHIEPLRDS